MLDLFRWLIDWESEHLDVLAHEGDALPILHHVLVKIGLYGSRICTKNLNAGESFLDHFFVTTIPLYMFHSWSVLSMTKRSQSKFLGPVSRLSLTPCQRQLLLYPVGSGSVPNFYQIDWWHGKHCKACDFLPLHGHLQTIKNSETHRWYQRISDSSLHVRDIAIGL